MTRQLKIGLESTSYRPYHHSDEESYALMREHGYSCMDGQMFADTETELFEVSEAEFERRLRENRALAESFGLSYSQVHGPWRWPVRDFTEEDLRERFAVMKKSLRGAAILGAPICVIHCIMPFGDNNPEHKEELWDMNQKFFGRLCGYAKEYGVVIGFENLPFTSLPLSRTPDTLAFVKMMDTAEMRVCFDTGHCAVYGDSPADAVRMIGKEWLGCLHVHDNDGHLDLHQPMGCGVIDWADFARALVDIDYEGVVSLETHIAEAGSPEERDRLERKLASDAMKIARGEGI